MDSPSSYAPPAWRGWRLPQLRRGLCAVITASLALALVPTVCWSGVGTPAGSLSRVISQQYLRHYDLSPVDPQLRASAFQAVNATQGITCRFSAAGVSVAPIRHKGPSWSFRIKLTAWGYPGFLLPVAEAEPAAERNRAVYHRDRLSEWFVNTPRGLEHGFTVNQPPPGHGDMLELRLAALGSLRVAPAGDRSPGVELRRPDGRVVLRYGELRAADATGRRLPATMTADRSQDRGNATAIVLAVDARGAQYPVTVDPLLVHEAAKLIGSTVSAPGDYFGYSVDVSADTVVVGALNDTGFAFRSGTAYVFERNHGGRDAWGEAAKLAAPDGDDFDWFGYAVAIDGDTIVVGAPRAEPGTFPDDNYGFAYVFERDQGEPDAWGFVAQLAASDASPSDEFGTSVETQGDRVVVGAYTGLDCGSAYVFERNQGGLDAWGQVTKITGGYAEPCDTYWGGFGTAGLSLEADTLAVGAWGDRDCGGPNCGAAFVFERNRGGAEAWGQVVKVVAPDADLGDYFGLPVALTRDTLLVAAPRDEAAGVDSGSVYVFERNTGGPDAWGAVVKLLSSDLSPGDSFGRGIGLESGTILAGSPGADAPGPATGSLYVFERNQQGPDAWGEIAVVHASDGQPGDGLGESAALSAASFIAGAHHDDDVAPDSGAAYVFAFQGDAWDEQASVGASDGAPDDRFGSAVAMSGERVVVGAPGADDLGEGAGAAYVLDRNHGGADHWGQVAKLMAADGAPGDAFGQALALDGIRAFIAAPLADHGASDSGAVYVLERNQGGADAWGEVVKVVPSDPSAGKGFGGSVAVDGRWAAVGGPGDSDAGDGAGAVYVLERNQGGADRWGQVLKVVAAGVAAGDGFGSSVSISLDTLVVGGPGAGPLGDGSGAACVFARNQGGADAWGQVAVLTASDGAAGDAFGAAVWAFHDRVVVGARWHDAAGSNSGAAYVFERNAGGADAWGQVAKLLPQDAAAGDSFGRSVSISGSRVAVGAPRQDALGGDSGALYVFERNVGGADAWGQLAKVTASNGAAGDMLGNHVSLSGNFLAAGAYRRDISGTDSGAAYVFQWVWLGDPIFRDGFESGDTSRWSKTVPGTIAIAGCSRRSDRG